MPSSRPPDGMKVQHLLFLLFYNSFHPTPPNRCPTLSDTTPADIRTNSQREQYPPDAICATRDGEAPDYSRTLKTCYFLAIAGTQLYISETASHFDSTASG
jgi:hypothetical protein